MQVRRMAFITSLLALAAGPIAAQDPDAAASSREEKTAVYLTAGYSSGTSDMGGAALGGMLVRSLSSRLAIEATGTYVGSDMGSNALSGSVALLVRLRHPREKAVPYLVAGGGLYHASFDMGRGRFAGPMNMSGSMMGSFGMMGMGGPAPNAQWNFGQMPHFYGERLARMGLDGSALGRRSFTDPAVSLGAGLRIDLGSHLDLRPDGRALVVTSGGDTYTVGVLTVNLGYRF